MYLKIKNNFSIGKRVKYIQIFTQVANHGKLISVHIMNAIVEIRNSKKRRDNKSITEFIQKNYSIIPILTSSRKLLQN